MCKWKDEKRRVEDDVPDEGDAPQPRVINAGDDDLACGEFEEILPGGFAMCRNQALRNEDDFRAGAMCGVGDGIVVADRAAPFVKNVQAFEGFAIHRGRAAPCEVTVVVAKDAHS